MALLEENPEVGALDLLASALTPQLRSTLMEGLSDTIMRKIAFSLSQRMRCPVQLLSCVNGVISHDSALSALPDVMLAGIADLAPLHGRIIIAVEGDLIGTVVDAMFGATSSEFSVRQELSSMELRIGKQMIELTLAGICEVLSSFTPLNWTIVQYETAVGMLAIADKLAWMISTTGIFETALGIGSIRAIVPYSAFEPFEARVNTQTWLIGPSLVDQRWANTITRLTGATFVGLQFDIVRAQVPLGLVKSMRTGQILPLAILPHVVGHAAGLDLFHAEYGQSDGRICCRPASLGDRQILILGAQHPLEKPRAPTVQHKLHHDPAGVDLSSTPMIDRVLVDLTVRLGEASLTVDGINRLRIGQLIRLDNALDDPLTIFVGGREFGSGKVVSMGSGRCGLKVTALTQNALAS